MNEQLASKIVDVIQECEDILTKEICYILEGIFDEWPKLIINNQNLLIQQFMKIIPIQIIIISDKYIRQYTNTNFIKINSTENENFDKVIILKRMYIIKEIKLQKQLIAGDSLVVKLKDLL